MRSLIYVFLFFSVKSYSQDLSIANCLSGERQDLLKTAEKINTTNYLLNIRSNSNTSNFIRTDYIEPFANSWLFMMNANADTVWKKMLPNTQNAVYAKYINSFGFTLRVANFDFSSQIYTTANDELILNYSYYDSLSNLVSLDSMTEFFHTYDSVKKVNNVLMNFGSVNISDGSYKIEPFIIDTLLSFPKDTSITLETAITHKINDSIYEMAVVYNKQYYDGVFSTPRSWKYLKLYTINSNSKSVIKNVYQYNVYDKLITVDNRFYWLQNTSFPNACFFNKIGIDGTIELTQILNAIRNVTNINYVKQSNTNSLLLGSSYDNVLIYKINLSDLSFDTNYYNANSTAFYSYSSLSNIPNFSKYKSPYSILENANTQNDFYCLLNESYKETDTSQIINTIYLAKINEVTGIVTSKNEIGSKKIMDIDENKILLCNDSIYEYVDFSLYYHNNIQQLDSNYNLVWNTVLPDSLFIDNEWYFAASEIVDYFPVNYHNQFIISVFYDEANNGGNKNINVFFLVSNETGLVKRIKLTTEEGSVFRSTYQTSEMVNLCPVFCFSTSNNDLSIISCNANQCVQADSTLNVIIYKYNEIVSSIKNNKTITKGDFILFPNPTNNMLTIQFNSLENIEDKALKIMDISGRIIYNTTLQNTQQYSIDVNGFPDGIYFLQVDDAKDFHQTKKFQVIH